MSISPIASQHFSILNDIAKSQPALAANMMGKTFRDLMALQMIDSFLDAQRSRIMSGAYSTYSTNGAAGNLERSFYYSLASSLIAMA